MGKTITIKNQKPQNEPWQYTTAGNYGNCSNVTWAHRNTCKKFHCTQNPRDEGESSKYWFCKNDGAYYRNIQVQQENIKACKSPSGFTSSQDCKWPRISGAHGRHYDNYPSGGNLPTCDCTYTPTNDTYLAKFLTSTRDNNDYQLSINGGISDKSDFLGKYCFATGTFKSQPQICNSFKSKYPNKYDAYAKEYCENNQNDDMCKCISPENNNELSSIYDSLSKSNSLTFPGGDKKICWWQECKKSKQLTLNSMESQNCPNIKCANVNIPVALDNGENIQTNVTQYVNCESTSGGGGDSGGGDSGGGVKVPLTDKEKKLIASIIAIIILMMVITLLL